MYVRKFEADTLDEALKSIKRELGPDAIILKTVTNKGIKGAFKRKRIEITAAISEKNYISKANVDKVLTEDQKEEFYSGRASEIAKMIDKNDRSYGGYGNIGLNKPLKSATTDLDNFLEGQVEEGKDDFSKFLDIPKEAPVVSEIRPTLQNTSKVENQYEIETDSKTIQAYEQRIELLESSIRELKNLIENPRQNGPRGIFQLRTLLSGLGICGPYIQRICKKAVFELTPESLEDAESVFEFSLREMMSDVNTAMPLFSQTNIQNNQVITVLISETSSGQESLALKLGVLKEDSVLIDFGQKQVERDFVQKIHGIEYERVDSMAKAIYGMRKGLEEKKSVIVNYRSTKDKNETKKIIDGIKRAFDNVEILLTLSSIHSEDYNRKVLNIYKDLIDGINFTFLDQCLNFAGIFNLSYEFSKIPLKFFGTGEVIPEDIEAASAERVLDGIFKL
ncbi:MAG: hypothetical protein H6622_06645 [Halobacteriovoraceae bacterium]|nr:hypothetical protein [Halobacteriovoraceae bacterium]